jgi:hypothetical protein
VGGAEETPRIVMRRIGENVTQTRQIQATRLLLGQEDIRSALGAHVRLSVSRVPGAAASIGSVVAAAARDSAYRSYTGTLTVEDTERPIAVGMMGLVFASTETAERTFTHVASAAHMRARVRDCNVAVETVTAPNGLVSYWGFLQRRESIVILTLDTMDPQIVSMTDFRSLVMAAAERIESATP